MAENNFNVVICGGGVIGTSVAYFLAKRGVLATVVEKDVIAGAASGKAGGFLARDWNPHSPLEKFSEISFDLHEQLARDLDGEKEYGYRKLTSYSVTLDDRKTHKELHAELPQWLDGEVVTAPMRIGSTNTTAQVHPHQFCNTLHNVCVKMGVKFYTGTEVIGIMYHTSTNSQVITLDSHKELRADKIVIAMGPWSGKIKKWMPSMPEVIYGQKAHSITVKPKVPVTADAIFTTYGNMSPDIYPRPDGEVYICGMAENPKPSNIIENAGAVTVTSGSCERLKTIIGKTSATLREGNIICKQACYIPVTQDGLPLIGNLQAHDDVYIAAGHGCWGILNAPVTGLVMSELIIDGCGITVDLSPFNPDRF